MTTRGINLHVQHVFPFMTTGAGTSSSGNHRKNSPLLLLPEDAGSPLKLAALGLVESSKLPRRVVGKRALPPPALGVVVEDEQARAAKRPTRAPAKPKQRATGVK
jgi:hypothetical protein